MRLGKIAFVLVAAFLFIAQARADIVIGVAGPLTGQQASFGDQFRRGADMAVKHINAKGGILGQKIQLEMADDACDPKQAVAVANQLVAKEAKAVIGHFCSGSSIPASEVYAEEEIVQISPASTNPLLTERGLVTLFRVVGRDDQQGAVAAQYILDNHKNSNLAIIHDKSAYGKGLADETRRLLEQKDKSAVLFEAINPGEKDYSALISKLKAANVDFIYFGGYHQEAGLIVRQARQQDLNAPLMAGDSLATKDYWSIVGNIGNGTLMTFNPDPRLNPKAADVVAAFRKINIDPEGYTLYTYAAFEVLAQAAKIAGTLNGPALAKAMRQNSFETVMGKIGFNAKGDVGGPGYVVYEWKEGQYKYATGVKAN